MKKVDFIAKYGEEAYKHKQQLSKEWRLKAGETNRKGELIAKYGEEWYEGYKERARERYHTKGLTEEQKRRRSIANSKAAATYFKHPVHKLLALVAQRKQRFSVVTPDEAMTLLMKEADECGCSKLLNMDYMIECFHNNCKYGLVYGNLEILKYFYRLMQIKVAKNESFTESDIEMLHYFRSWKVGKIKPGVLLLNNEWVIDVINVDMTYVEDMMRHTKGIELLLTEEKYNEMKRLADGK